MRPPRWQPTCLCTAVSSLRDGQVHLWFAPLALQRPWVEAYASVLTPLESHRLSRLAGGVVRERFVVGRGMLRLLLGSYLGLDARAVEFTNPPGGKPTVALSTRTRPVAFSLSHSGEACLAAFRAGDDIGIDMEWVRDLKDCEDIAARWFPPAERRAFFAARPDERPRRFMLCWTQVEARAKADGSGLGGIFARADWSRTWRVCDVEPPGNYVASLAFRHPAPKLDRYCVRPASCCFESRPGTSVTPPRTSPGSQRGSRAACPDPPGTRAHRAVAPRPTRPTR